MPTLRKERYVILLLLIPSMIFIVNLIDHTFFNISALANSHPNFLFLFLQLPLWLLENLFQKEHVLTDDIEKFMVSFQEVHE